MASKLFIALALGCAAMLPAAAQERPDEARDMARSMGMEGLSGKKLAKAIAKAERNRLGSKANPVRENMPEGQRAYLARLRCADGGKPASTRRGNVGPGIYGNIIDHYTLTCRGAGPVDV